MAEKSPFVPADPTVSVRCGLYAYDGMHVWVHGGQSVLLDDLSLRVACIILAPGPRNKHTYFATLEEFKTKFRMLCDRGDVNGYEMEVF